MPSEASVLAVTNVYLPYLGGISTYVANLRRATSPRFPAQVLAYPPIFVEFESRQPRSPLRHLFHIAFLAAVLAVVIAHRMRGEKVIVHSHSAAFCLLGSGIARLFGARSVHTFHSPLQKRSRIIEWVSPRIDALVFVSPALQEQYRRSTSAENRNERVIPGGVDLVPLTPGLRSRARSELEASLGIHGQSILVLYVGRVVRDKGVDFLADAVQRLEGTDIVVLVAGPRGQQPQEKTFYDELREVARKTSGHFQLLGEVTVEMLERLYAACDMAVVPSVWEEPAPLAALEAMAHGLPVVASRIGGIPFLVPDGRAGILVPPGNAAELSKAIHRVATDSNLRERLGKQAFEWIQERHSLGRFGEEHAALYEYLLSAESRVN